MLLSVIVPIYNVEKFLPHCLDSLLRQGWEGASSADALMRGEGDYEVICVDDGSTDRSAQILADYAQRHAGVFRVITQENQGVSAARNAGLEVARGEWVTFLDSDDYLVDGAYHYLFTQFCSKGDFDLLSFGYRNVKTGGTTPVGTDASPAGKVLFEGDGVEPYNRHDMNFVWTKFFRRDFLSRLGVRFPPIPYFEEELFLFEVFHAHPRMLMTSSVPVYYEKGNATSAMNTVNRTRVCSHLDSLLQVIDMMQAYLDEGHTTLASAARRVIDNAINNFYNKAFHICLSHKEWQHYMTQLKAKPIHKMLVKGSRFQRLIAQLKNWTGTSYLAYLLFRILHLYLLKPLLS